MKKTLFSLLCMILCSAMLYAQTANSFQYKFPEKKNGPFNKLDVALTLGSTGVGIDVASPVTDFMQVRAGFTYMPKFEYKMNFPIEVGEGTREEQQSKFNELSAMLEQFTGHAVDDNVDMLGEPTFSNFKLMLDFFPLEDKRWHLTAGFYLGSSSIGKAYNTTGDMPSLFAVKMYNHMYDNKVIDELYQSAYDQTVEQAIAQLEEKIANDEPILVMGDMAIYGTPEMVDMFRERFEGNYPEMPYNPMEYGRMGITMGQKADGSTYRMEPDKNSMVSAKMKVNRFRPYLGFGYGSSMMNNNSKYNISFDCGVMMWGGTPSILTHDGTDLAKDVKNVPGKVGDYVKLAKKFKVFPVVEVRFSRRLF